MRFTLSTVRRDGSGHIGYATTPLIPGRRVWFLRSAAWGSPVIRCNGCVWPVISDSLSTGLAAGRFAIHLREFWGCCVSMMIGEMRKQCLRFLYCRVVVDQPFLAASVGLRIASAGTLLSGGPLTSERVSFESHFHELMGRRFTRRVFGTDGSKLPLELRLR